MTDPSGADLPRALLLAFAPRLDGEDGTGERATELIELMTDGGWSVSVAAAGAVDDPQLTHDLRQSGISVYDATSARFEAHLRDRAYKVVVCLAWEVAELYLGMVRRAAPDAAVIVDALALPGVRDGQRFLAEGVPVGVAPAFGSEYGSSLAGEISVYASADVVLTGAAEEAALVNVLVGADRAVCVPEALAGSPTAAGPEGRSGIVLAAALPDPDCVDAARQLHQEVLPLIDPIYLNRQSITIPGSSATSEPMLHNLGLVVPGAAATPTALLARARVSVMPLSRNVGRRMLVQSLWMGTPLVASRAALAGLRLDAGTHALVADDPVAFAAAIKQLLTDDSVWRRLSAAGRTQIEASYGRGRVKEQLLRAMALACERRASERRSPVAGRPETFALRTASRRNRAAAPAIREAVRQSVPAGARLLVLSGGSDQLLRLGLAHVSHFPPLTPGGDVAEVSDSKTAIALLEREIRAGAEFLVIPATTFDWLRAYPGFGDHLRRAFTLQEEPACTIVRLKGLDSERLAARLIAFYLPQYYPTPENDAAWGRGFTEWSNVARVRPLFPGHYQPHVPGELGFYDLRLPQTRTAQAALAAEAGIHAFCYYHYWFNGKRLLGQPFDEVLASGEPDFPFCLCWANEPWSRRWDGSDDQVIQPQAYSPEDDREHIRWLLPALRDPRAVTVDGKPVFLVYHADDLPEPARTADTWREEVRNAGLPGLYLIAVETDRDAGWDATREGFDAKLRFQPRFSTLRTLSRDPVAGAAELQVWDYDESWKQLWMAEQAAYRCYETVCPGWDNSPRVGERGWILHDASPAAYGRWLSEAIERTTGLPSDQRLVFINAWNEWAEGAHLEPDRRHGRAYLEATRAAAVREDPVPTTAETGSDPAAPTPTEPITENGVPGRGSGGQSDRQVRAIAFYLPQFHPTPENDEFWGPGFTEWTNVMQAGPLFEGHRQPQVPAELGFYDLRVPEVREAQARLARAHGIEAFCYWHYWFDGRRPLGGPLEDVLASGEPNFPFCLAWANEPWSRTWLGDEAEILIDCRYSPEDDLAHARWLVEVFADARYLRVLGRPVFVVYRPAQLEDARRFTEVLRSECARAGSGNPLLLGTTAWDDRDHRLLGFDGAIEFEPRLGALGDPLTPHLKVHDYAEARSRMSAARDFPVYPSVLVGWDNTPRRGMGGTVLTNATPEAFRAALERAALTLADRPLDDRLLFVNAWNEWGEGNRLEPEQQHGFGYLDAVGSVVFEDRAPSELDSARPSAAPTRK